MFYWRRDVSICKKEYRTFSEEFKREAARLVETSGVIIKYASEDIGVGLSTLTRLLRIYRYQKLLSVPHDDMDKDLARLRRQNEFLRAERDLISLRRGSRFNCQGNNEALSTTGSSEQIE